MNKLKNLSAPPLLIQLSSPLNFIPTFLGVTFHEGQLLSSSQDIALYLCFHMGPPKESLSLLYKTFLRSFLTCASPGWFPFLNVTKLERLHQAASRSISDRLSFSLIPIFSEVLLPSLQVTLTHFTLSYVQALCPPTSFSTSGFGVNLYIKVVIVGCCNDRSEFKIVLQKLHMTR